MARNHGSKRSSSVEVDAELARVLLDERDRASSSTTSSSTVPCGSIAVSRISRCCAAASMSSRSISMTMRSARSMSVVDRGGKRMVARPQTCIEPSSVISPPFLPVMRHAAGSAPTHDRPAARRSEQPRATARRGHVACVRRPTRPRSRCGRRRGARVQRMPGGRSSSAKNSLPGRNCAHVDGVLMNRTLVARAVGGLVHVTADDAANARGARR